MSSLSTLEQFVTEARAIGMDLDAPIEDTTTPIEELRNTLEELRDTFESISAPAAVRAPTLPRTKQISLEQLEAASKYLTSAPEDNECAICITELVAADNKAEDNLETSHQTSTAIRLDTCGHVFHSGCILEWMKESNTCPFCRRKVCEEHTKEMEGRGSPIGWSDEEDFWAAGLLWLD
ncbi:RING/U-box [Karstenula rhodostoma CBS 690.94]|uniref:RING/U-box n=1 Tax=Karstenula rhodostoma CBS 690.94 TaxID=1392251 RepID=A0A9P4UID3_9PLEO|nr:RING/U-box [Karstenula rhodostoma CBS 690.94]